MKILFVCGGNVGRSQMAESIFNSLSDARHISISAGTDVTRGDDNSREGQSLRENPDAIHVITAMHEIGLDVSGNVRKHIKPEMVSTATKVVSMVEPEAIPDHLRKLPDIVYWEVADPYNESLEFTRAVRNKIQTLVKQLLSSLS